MTLDVYLSYLSLGAIKPKFNYADFVTKSAADFLADFHDFCVCDFHRNFPARKVGVMEFGLNLLPKMQQNS